MKIEKEHEINKIGYCECGFMKVSGYEPWEGINSRGKQVRTYRTPSNTKENYGSLNKNEVVTVIGECRDCYFIEYTLTNVSSSTGRNSNKKYGYVKKADIYDKKVVDMYNYFLEDGTVFESSADLAYSEFSEYYEHEISAYAAIVVSDIKNLTDVFTESRRWFAGDDLENLYYKRALRRLIDGMDDQYYKEVTVECADALWTFLSFLDEHNINEITAVFEGFNHVNAVIAVKSAMESIHLDITNDLLFTRLDELFELGISDDLFMGKIAEILTYRNYNLNKKDALKTVNKLFSFLGKGTYGLVKVLCFLDKATKVKKVVIDPFLYDIETALFKLDIIINSFDQSTNEKAYKAAISLRNEFSNRLNIFAKNAKDVGIDVAVGGLGKSLWALVSVPLNITVGDEGECVKDFAYFCDYEIRLDQYLRTLYNDTKSKHIPSQYGTISKSLHALADCRSIMNNMAIEINNLKILFWKINESPETILLEEYAYYYSHKSHDKIKSLFN